MKQYVFGLGRATWLMIKTNKTNFITGGLVTYELGEHAEILPPLSTPLKNITEMITSISSEYENGLSQALSIKDTQNSVNNNIEDINLPSLLATPSNILNNKNENIISIIEKYKTQPAFPSNNFEYRNLIYPKISRNIPNIIEVIPNIIDSDNPTDIPNIIDSDNPTNSLNPLPISQNNQSVNLLENNELKMNLSDSSNSSNSINQQQISDKTVYMKTYSIDTVINATYETKIDLNENQQLQHWLQQSISIENTESLKKEILRCNTLIQLNTILKNDATIIEEHLNFAFKNIDNYITENKRNFNTNDYNKINNYLHKKSNSLMLNNEFRTNNFATGIENIPIQNEHLNGKKKLSSIATPTNPDIDLFFSGQEQNLNPTNSINNVSPGIQNNDNFIEGNSQVLIQINQPIPSNEQNLIFEQQNISNNLNTQSAPNLNNTNISNSMLEIDNNAYQKIKKTYDKLRQTYPTFEEQYKIERANSTNDEDYLNKRELEKWNESIKNNPNYQIQLLSEKIQFLENELKNQKIKINDNLNLLSTSYQNKIKKIKDVFINGSEKIKLLEERAEINLKKIIDLYNKHKYVSWAIIGLTVGYTLFKNPEILSFCVNAIKKSFNFFKNYEYKKLIKIVDDAHKKINIIEPIENIKPIDIIKPIEVIKPIDILNEKEASALRILKILEKIAKNGIIQKMKKF